MFQLTVRDHVMIAHSLPRPAFGPAQNLHGATFVVELTFRREQLGPDSIVIDIGEASSVLGAVLGDLNYRNLDEHPAFAGRLSTTEAVAQHIAERVAEKIAAEHFVGIDVLLREHPDAWAGYRLDFD